ncbi:ATP-binding protein [Flavobacterium sediminilitoris]|uniref:histidine kinase n=1 Tax=Flavobacterium sediminilitoris TaxID=2024526 RepID=A0ABY4HN19_9FLAO|nr:MULTISPECIES: response regulator [Flavobacterium]UOX33214.1 ATP-binding protein [Flavobacterium sediminilitoris]
MKNYLKTILIFFSLVFSIVVFSQDTISSNKEIHKLLQTAGKQLNTLETDLSLQNAKKALALAINIEDNVSIAKSYNYIGLNIVEHSDYEKAIEYFKKGIFYANKTKNDTIKSWIYNNLGNLYSYNKNEYEKAIKYYLLSLKYAKKVSIVELTYNKINIAGTYFEINEFEKGKKYLNSIKLDITPLKKEYEAQFLYYSLNADYYLEKNNLKLAEQNYLKALSICSPKPKDFYIQHEIDINESLSDFYSKLKQYEKAYYYLNISDSLKEVNYDDSKNRKVKLLGQQIEQEEIERELLKVEAEKKIQDQKLLNIKIFIILICLIFLATLIILYSQFKINKIRTKSNIELKKANEELKIAKEKAEEASKLKSQFVSTVSHELRTPLYGVIGITDIIELEHKELENSQHLRALKFSAKYLLSLVNDILKVYKFEENQVFLENNLFHLQDRLETIKDSINNIALKHNNKIIISVDEKIPEYIIGDSIRLSQIIINLMSNSLKFTNNGKIEIKAQLAKVVKDVFYIEFKVIDTGIGIPKKYQDKVFEKFVQIDRREDDYQGTGLGLTIVKRLIDLFKGEIKLESEENIGTTFTFTIPFESGEKEKNEFIKNINVDLSQPKIYNVLIVEDNKINQIVTKKLLENYKLACQIAEDGFVALELLEHQKFDIILMDINMPKINGFETTKLIRQKGYTLPIIAVTAFEKEEVEEKAKSSGINDIIAKPFDAKQLFQMIKLNINIRSK